VRDIDLLKLFWEPGVTDIQQSRHLFVGDYVDEDILKETYPQLKENGFGSDVDIQDYIREDSVDYSGKAAVVDWYYKKPGESGGTVLHYCKFVGDEILFASENDPAGYPDGWYAHGLFPVVLDVLYPRRARRWVLASLISARTRRCILTGSAATCWRCPARPPSPGSGSKRAAA
jgi:hypothetical protein